MAMVVRTCTAPLGSCYPFWDDRKRKLTFGFGNSFFYQIPYGRHQLVPATMDILEPTTQADPTGIRPRIRFDRSLPGRVLSNLATSRVHNGRNRIVVRPSHR